MFYLNNAKFADGISEGTKTISALTLKFQEKKRRHLHSWKYQNPTGHGQPAPADPAGAGRME